MLQCFEDCEDKLYYKMKPTWAATRMNWINLDDVKVGESDKNSLEQHYPLNEFNLNSNLIQCKSGLDMLPTKVKRGKDFILAREIINPFEGIGNLGCQNRSAVKLLEMDYLLNGGMVKNYPGEEFYFLDLCGAPGGFSECIFKLSRKPTKGLGVTLKGTKENSALEWNLDPITRLTDVTREFSSMFADLTSSDDIKLINDRVKEITKGQLCDLVVCDGGVDVSGREMEQEIIHHPLILSQLLAGVLCCKGSPNSHLMCKIYDSACSLSKYFIILAAQFFKRIDVKKPSQSRPASSERFVIFEGRLTSQEMAARGLNQVEIVTHMFELLHQINEIAKEEKKRVDEQNVSKDQVEIKDSKDSKDSKDKVESGKTSRKDLDLNKLKQPRLLGVDYLDEYLNKRQLESEEVQLQHLQALQETLDVLSELPDIDQFCGYFAYSSSSSFISALNIATDMRSRLKEFLGFRNQDHQERDYYKRRNHHKNL